MRSNHFSHCLAAVILLAGCQTTTATSVAPSGAPEQSTTSRSIVANPRIVTASSFEALERASGACVFEVSGSFFSYTTREVDGKPALVFGKRRGQEAQEQLEYIACIRGKIAS